MDDQERHRRRRVSFGIVAITATALVVVLFTPKDMEAAFNRLFGGPVKISIDMDGGCRQGHSEKELKKEGGQPCPF